jgi:hypothetical protein
MSHGKPMKVAVDFPLGFGGREGEGVGVEGIVRVTLCDVARDAHVERFGCFEVRCSNKYPRVW